jgi:archaellum biogenesis ATPase FlaH
LTDNVVSLQPSVELLSFFDYMWGDHEGYVYVPIKEPESDRFEERFFQWPLRKNEVVRHVLEVTSVAEVYFGPALYIEPTHPVPENILGAQVLWAEFDGNTPSGGVLGDKIPHPTMRVRSSFENHEHLYWKLDYFETDRTKIEQINRSLAYTLQADTSGWDSTQILRPPSTKNHKRDRVVHVVSQSASEYAKDFFSALEIPKQLVKEEIVLEEVPDVISVIAKYRWDSEEFLFFRKQEIAEGTRSSALMRLAFDCAEMRMSDEEAYAILRNADDRWKKFSKRADRDKRLLGLLNRARLKYPLDPEAKVDGLQVYGWEDIKQLEIHIDWLIPGILQRQGIMVVTGKPSVGKTQLTVQSLIKMALGKPMLGWDITIPRKTLFFSMEMGVAEIKLFLAEMDKLLDDEERALLQENFKIIPIGQSIYFDDSADKKKIAQVIEAIKPEVVGFDSLSKTTASSLTDEVAVKKVMDFADELRMHFDCSIIMVHHDRKAQVGNKKPNNLEDMYGSFYIGATATTVIGLWSNHKTYEIELSYLKVRLAQAPKTQIIIRTTQGLDFEEVKPSGLLKQAEELMNEEPKHQKPELPPGSAYLGL